MESPARALFPATAWTLVRRVQSGDVQQAAGKALDALCRTYWAPVNRYFIALGCLREEADDVTQEFFASFLRTGGFDKADPSIARLRTFIKHAAARFLANHWRKTSAQRRGGGRRPESLDVLPEDCLPDDPSAAATYDAEWARTVLRQALAAVEQGYAARGRQAVFDAVKHSLLRPGAAGSIAETAGHLGCSESQVRLAMHRARQRLAAALRAEVTATVDAPGDADDEVRYLMSILARTA